MKFIEVEGNLFNTKEYTSDEVVFAHCIASDFGMHGGIATQFIERFHMKQKLIGWSRINTIDVSIENVFNTSFGAYRTFTRPSLVGKAVKIGSVYNLVTKRLTRNRPTIKDFQDSLVDMRKQMVRNNDSVLAIPDMIGCGIDMLDRQQVVDIIHEVFKNTDITVYAVKLKHSL